MVTALWGLVLGLGTALVVVGTAVGVIVTTMCSIAVDVLIFHALIPFLSTSFGVLMAYLLTVCWDRRKAWEGDSQLVRDAAQKIKREIEHNLRQAKNWPAENSGIPNLDFLADAKNTAIHSGAFRLLDPELAYELSHVYAVMERARSFRDWGLMNSNPRSYAAGFQNQVRYFVQRVEGEDAGQPEPLIPRLEQVRAPARR